MELVNELYLFAELSVFTPTTSKDSNKSQLKPSTLHGVLRNLTLLLAPMAPYLAHELWDMIGERSNLLKAPWPTFSPALIEEEQKERPIQVDGKLRSVIVVPSGASEELLKERILADEKIRRATAGKQIVAVIHATNISNVVTGTVSFTSKPEKQK
jgi:leucyl-tRNA synthetase